MLAENLVDMPYSQNLETETSQINQPPHQEEVAEENLSATIPDDLGLYHSDICCMCQDLIFVLFFKHFLFQIIWKSMMIMGAPWMKSQ
jgi:hypothetical protein